MNGESRYIGAPVRSLQTMLALLARAGSAIPSVIPDGLYGPETERSVAAFQRTRGLAPTGIVDHATWMQIVNAYYNLLPCYAPAAPLCIVWQPEQVILPGEENTHLYLIQAMLLALSHHLRAMPRPAVTGVHDAASVAAMQWFQAHADLPATGQIRQLDWAALTGLYRLVARDGTPRAAL